MMLFQLQVMHHQMTWKMITTMRR